MTDTQPKPERKRRKAVSREARQKMSDALKSRWRDEAYRNRQTSAIRKGLTEKAKSTKRGHDDSGSV